MNKCTRCSADLKGNYGGYHTYKNSSIELCKECQVKYIDIQKRFQKELDEFLGYGQIANQGL